jgi:hypothetical protein
MNLGAEAGGLTMTRSGVARRPPHREWIGAGVGAILGFVFGAVVYVLLTPALEASSGILREMQGLSWNLVPGLTLLGAILGWVLGARR